MLDGGDAISRENHLTEKTSIQLRIAGETMLEGMRLMGYDALGLGEGDLLFGGRFIRQAAGARSLPILSSSIIRAGSAEPLGREALFVEAGGRRIGVASVLSQSFAPFVAEHQDPDEPLAILPTEVALERALQALARADLKILLFHAPHDEISDLLREVRGFDIAIGGHGTQWMRFAEPLWIEETAVVQTGFDGEMLGRLDIRLLADGSFQISGGREIVLGAAFPNDPRMVELHDSYLGRVAAAIQEILAQHPPLPPPKGTRYVGSATCQACHEEEAASWRRTKHARAWWTLFERRRDYDPECYPCHTVGFGYEGGFRIPDETPDRVDVGCESCHGAGADHVARPGAPYGRPIGEADCRTCHNPIHSPQFDYPSYRPQVEHAR